MHSAALCCFASKAKCSDLGLELSKKWLVTLDKLVMPPIPLNWFEGVSHVLEAAPIFHRMCWLKSVAGAWCTSVRLSTYEDRGCCFGCTEARDEITHYLQCPILWQFARETFKMRESSICVFERMCLLSPSLHKLRIHACCHSLYHSVINDPHCVCTDGSFANSLIVQRRAFEICNYCLHIVGDGA